MIISKDHPVLVLRVSNYRSHDFIVEHQKMLLSHGQVWMLKIGKNIPIRSLKEVSEAGGILLLKTPKQQGSKWYVAHMMEYYHGSPNNTMDHPDYYLNMMVNSEEVSLNGTWIKIDKLFEVSEHLVDEFTLIANGHSLKEVINSTRTSFLYACCKNTVDLHAEGYLKEKNDEQK